jgi:hypothetical protein
MTVGRIVMTACLLLVIYTHPKSVIAIYISFMIIQQEKKIAATEYELLSGRGGSSK